MENTKTTKKRYDSQLKAHKNYNHSEKGKMTRAEWLKTEEGQESVKNSNKKYVDEGKRKEWLNTEKGQEYLERENSEETRARRINANYKVAEFIKNLRQDKGLTLKEFAERCGVNFTLVAFWEKGEFRPQFDVIQRMAFEFGFKAKNLVALVREAEKNSKNLD